MAKKIPGQTIGGVRSRSKSSGNDFAQLEKILQGLIAAWGPRFPGLGGMVNGFIKAYKQTPPPGGGKSRSLFKRLL